MARLDRTRAVLGVIRDRGRDPERDVEFELARHRRAIVDALRDYLPGERSLIAEPGERKRTATRVQAVEVFVESAGLDLSAESVEHRVTVPADFVGLLVEALLSELILAAQHVEDAGLDPASYPRPLARFDAIRALLDAIGWGEHDITEIDLDDHQDVLARALAARLAMERDCIIDAEGSPTARGAREQREHAHGYALQIERFMHDAGLEIPEAGERDA